MHNNHLFVERFGKGTPLVLLHGWGMHRVLLRQFATALAGQYEIILMDLPGHGNSARYENADNIESYVSYLHAALPQSTSFHLCGWSMGAMLALQFARQYPAMVRKLVLFTATPCFTNRPDWAAGVALPALQQVGNELAQDYHKAMSRFLMLQLMNLPDARDWVRCVRDMLQQEPVPQVAALQQGLQLLAASDLRPLLMHIHCPTLILNGDRDSLIPAPATRVLAEQLPDARAMLLHGSGHLPFVTHAAKCVAAVAEFLHA